MAHPDVVDLFLSAADKWPSRPAVVAGHSNVSYGELCHRVRRIAAIIASRSATRVLIALPQGAHAYGAMLATGLAGAFYAPVNIAAPIEKLRRVVSLFQPEIIISTRVFAVNLLPEAPAAYTIDPEFHDVDTLVATDGRRHELAYLIFTSGSTGVPKGVMISRPALAHFINWVKESQTVRVGDRISQHPNIAFDLSVLDIYGALCSGATLVPLQSEADRLMPERIIQREEITVWNSVPSVINLMAKSRRPSTSKHSVRLFSFCGEPLLKEHLEIIFQAYPDAIVQNTYGPTEATVSMTEIRLTRSSYVSACRASIALGKPIPGMAFHLVGGRCPTEGELVITGPQLAEGYWKDPKLTEQKFKPVTVDGISLRGYYTGDWVECIDGMYFFKERIDFQVKIRGFRIELDEVEAAIRKCGWPVVCSFKLGEALVAVIERQSDRPLDSAKLRASLAAHLEPHAIPEFIESIPQMPYNDNDKIDRKVVISWYVKRADQGV